MGPTSLRRLSNSLSKNYSWVKTEVQTIEISRKPCKMHQHTSRGHNFWSDRRIFNFFSVLKTRHLFLSKDIKISSIRVWEDLQIHIWNWTVWETAPPARFMMLGQTHMNGWSRVIASQNGGSTDYISPLRLGVLQWSHHLFNYWKNKKTIIEKEFLILLIWNLIYIDHRKITWLWS